MPTNNNEQPQGALHVNMLHSLETKIVVENTEPEGKATLELSGAPEGPSMEVYVDKHEEAGHIRVDNKNAADPKGTLILESGHNSAIQFKKTDDGATVDVEIDAVGKLIARKLMDVFGGTGRTEISGGTLKITRVGTPVLEVNDSSGGRVAELTPQDVGSTVNIGFGLKANGDIRLWIKDSGEVGIGTTDPSGVLDVRSGAVEILKALNDGGSPFVRIGDNAKNVAITPESIVVGGGGTPSSNPSISFSGTGKSKIEHDDVNNKLSLFTDGQKRATIDVDGNVGIGTVSPFSKLHIDIGTTGSPSFPFSLDNYAIFIPAAGHDVNYQGILGIGPDSEGIVAGILSKKSGTFGSQDLLFATGDNLVGASESFRIRCGGNIGIASQVPDETLSVKNYYFNRVIFYQGSTSSYIDYTTEAKTTEGAAYSVLTRATDYFYLGANSKFSSAFFAIASAGSNIALSAEYYNGSSWVGLTIDDGTGNLSHDGLVTFTPPYDWIPNGVNGYSMYWIRLKGGGYGIYSPAATAYFTVPKGSNRFSVYAQQGDTNPTLLADKNGNVGIGTMVPGAKLDVNGNIKASGSVQVGNNTEDASASNVGAIRYRMVAGTPNHSYVEMSMQYGSGLYRWEIIKDLSW